MDLKGHFKKSAAHHYKLHKLHKDISDHHLQRAQHFESLHNDSADGADGDADKTLKTALADNEFLQMLMNEG